MSAYLEFALHALRARLGALHAGAKGTTGPVRSTGIGGKANVPAGCRRHRPAFTAGSPEAAR